MTRTRGPALAAARRVASRRGQAGARPWPHDALGSHAQALALVVALVPWPGQRMAWLATTASAEPMLMLGSGCPGAVLNRYMQHGIDSCSLVLS